MDFVAIHTHTELCVCAALVDPASIDLMLATAGPIEMSSKSRNQPTGWLIATFLMFITQIIYEFSNELCFSHFSLCYGIIY